MEKPFDSIYVGIESQLLNSPEHIPDSPAVSAARKDGDTVDGLIVLGKALSQQLRYRQAILAYTQALKMDPDNRTVLRLRAGRYLTTLQSDLALRDFEQCLAFGGDKLDCGYRMGLAHYYAGRYSQAAQTFESCISLCDDEMGIAVIYWHTLSACRAGVAPSLLCLYNTGMKVGHHTAYEKAMRIWSGAEVYSDGQTKLALEPDDMEYAITQYGLAYHPQCPDRQKILTEIIARDGFWPCFSYLAAWNDLH